jgi:hypothetical protein
MNGIELKIFVFWMVFTSILWVTTKFHYAFTDTHLNWKTFKDEFSLFGAMHGVCLYIGCVVIAVYLIVKAAMWWFLR